MTLKTLQQCLEALPEKRTTTRIGTAAAIKSATRNDTLDEVEKALIYLYEN